MRIADTLGLDVDIEPILNRFAEKTSIIQFNKGESERWRQALTDAESDFLTAMPITMQKAPRDLAPV